MQRTRIAALMLVLAIALSVSLRAPQQPATDLPPPLDREPGEQGGEGFGEWRERWLESMLVAAPGVDPRALDAAYRGERMRRHQLERSQKLGAGADIESLKRFESPAISGVWRERGSSNQSGRTVGYVRDGAGQRGVVMAHGGNVWLGGAQGFVSPNDSATFPQARQIDRVLRNGRDRLLVPSAGDVLGFYTSDNWGGSYEQASGLSTSNVWYIRDLETRDPASADVYLLRIEYDFTARNWRARLWYSTDAGGFFRDLGYVGARNHSELFSPRHDSSEVYLLTGTQLQRIVPGSHTLQPVASLPLATVAEADVLTMTGGVTAGGQTFLYVLHSRSAENDTQVWRSLDGGTSFELRGSVATKLFATDSAESSTRDPNLLLVGGVNLFRSADGGLSFQQVSTWQEYYPRPADRLHADIMDIDIIREANGAEITWISTDGGTYRSDDYALNVVNQSLTSGLNVGQYYASYTRRSAPHTLMAGAQDQGYQRAFDPPTTGVLPMEQTISGDYGSLTSTDGGNNVWMVYPGFAMVDTATTTPGRGPLPRWDFSDNGLEGSEFIPALAAMPGQPNRALLAGGRFGGGSHHQVVELTLANGNITHVADPQVFPTAIGAVAYGANPAIRHVLDTGGRFWTSEAGAPYSTVTPAGPTVTTFRGTDILLDPSRPGRIYVAGAGYSNPAVFVSNDGGITFAPMANGLPSTLITRLAISQDGRHLFASARLGAFYYDSAAQQWVDLVTGGAPNQHYTDVDYIDALGVARFSTYGRGIWDFAVAGAVVVTGPTDEPRLDGYALPTPNPPNASCPAGFFSAVVDDGPGAGLTAGAFGMELLLNDPGTRVLAGGLNFGGLIDAGQVGFAGFTIANAANENQRLSLNLTGSPSSSSSASLPVRVRISRRPDANTSISVLDTTATVSLQAAYTTSLDLPPGFYEATVAPTSGSAGGNPEGQFYFSLTTSFIGRPGGGFQGGAVVGGYHAIHPFGGVSGFAAFCLATPHSTTVRVLSQPSYGPTGAKDLRLRLQDAQQRDVVVVPAGG